MNLNRTIHKALVAAITEITGEQLIYRKVPNYNYDLGDITVTKDNSVICPDDSATLIVLAEAGFIAENNNATEQTEYTGLMVNLPRDGFTDST